MDKIIFSPIGFIRSEFRKPKEIEFACEKGLRSGNVSSIVLEKGLGKGLKGLDGFSHIFVLYFLSESRKKELVTHPGPPSIKGLPKVGVFASRSQYRPNPIALRLVRLLKVKGNEIFVGGLDAVDGTPVLDIKPYVPGFDRPGKFRVASWYDWLE